MHLTVCFTRMLEDDRLAHVASMSQDASALPVCRSQLMLLIVMRKLTNWDDKSRREEKEWKVHRSGYLKSKLR